MSEISNSGVTNSIFTPSILNESITLQPNKITSNIDNIILKELKKAVGNKCGSHGYIDENSIVILKRTIGKLNTGHLNGSISYDVSYKAKLCNPIEGSEISCKIININKMGILAREDPLSIVLARQHHISNETFDSLKIGDLINVKIIGKRFELYDNQITAIGELV